MRLWRMVSPILLVIMLASQFAPAIESASVSAAPKEMLASGAVQDSTATELTTGDDGPVVPALANSGIGPSTVTVTSSANPASGPVMNAQIEPIAAHVYASTNDTGRGYTAIPSVVKDSAWPEVEIRIHNPNVFWLSVDVWSALDVEEVKPTSPSAALGYIPPGFDATYTVRFSKTTNSSLVFHVNGTFMMVPIAEKPGGMWLTIVDMSLGRILKMAGKAENAPALILKNAAKVQQLWNVVTTTRGCAPLVDLLADPAKLLENPAGNALQIYECMSSPAVLAILNDIAGDGNSSWVDKTLGPILEFSSFWAGIVVMLYQQVYMGAVAAEITFEASPEIERSELLVKQVNDQAQPVPGGCYALLAGEGSDRRVRGSICDEHDGQKDGTIRIVSVPWDSAILINRVPAAGYAPAADRTVVLNANETREITVELEPAAEFAVYVVDENEERVLHACFSLTANSAGDAGGSRSDPTIRCDASDGTADGLVGFDGLPSGEYTLAQTFAPFHYRPADDVVVTLESGTQRDITVTNIYTEFGNLVINLSGEDGSLPLGACFDVFNIDQAPHQFIARLCDDQAGVLSLDEIRFGNYRLVQVTTPDGYVAAADVDFAIVGGQQTTLNVRNRFPGSLQIRNIDDQGTLVGNGCFRLTPQYGTGAIERCDTNGDGVITITNLRPGEYRLAQSSSSSSDHGLALTTSVIIEPLMMTAVDMVATSLGTLVVLSVNESGEPLVGACYSLTKYKDDGSYQYSRTLCDSSDDVLDGKISFPRLEPGNHKLLQTKTPDLYQMVAVQEFVVPEAPGVVEHTVMHMSGGAVVVTTVDIENPDQLVRSEYRIYQNVDDERGESLTTIGFYIWTDQGYVTRFDHLAPGDYFLSQTYVNAGLFLVQEDIPFTIVAGEEKPVIVTNSSPYPNILILSVNASGDLLPGACYYAYWSWGGYNTTICDVDDGNQDGRILVRRAKPGTYSVTQSETPAGYHLAARTSVTVPAEPGAVELIIQHTAKDPTGSVLVTTYDEGTGIIVYPCYSVYTRGVMGDVYVGGTCSRADSTDGIRIDELAPGDYTLRQTDLERLKLLPLAQDIPFTIEGEEEETITVTNKPWPTVIVQSQNQQGELLPGACYRLGYRYSPRVCDGDDGAVDGRVTFRRVEPTASEATHTLYSDQVLVGYAYPDNVPLVVPQSPETIEVVVEHESSGGLVITTLDAETKLPVERACYEIRYYGLGAPGGLVDLRDAGCLPNSSSEPLAIHGLQPGEYSLTQVSSAEGLFRSEEAIRFTITAGQDTSVEVLNHPWPTVVIESYGGSDNLVAGSCYHLDNHGSYLSDKYRCDADDGANDGVITILRVLPGTYDLKQTSVPRGYAVQEPGVLTVPRAPGEVRVTIEHLPGGSLVINRTSTDRKCYRIYADSGSGDLDDPIASECQARFDGLAPGAYILQERAVRDWWVDIGPAYTFTIVAGQDTVIWIGATPAEQEIRFSLVAPAVGSTGTPVTISLGAQRSDGTPADLQAYTFAINCGTGYGEPSAQPGGECTFATPGEKTVRVKITRPDTSWFEMTAAVTVLESDEEPVTTGILEITAKDKNGQALPGVCFALQPAAGDGPAGDPIADSCNADGVARFLQLEPGVYTLSVTTVPQGYATPEAREVRIEAGTTHELTVVFTVVPQITLESTEAEAGWTVRLTGTRFAPNEVLEIRWGAVDGPIMGDKVTATTEGAIDIRVTIPADASVGPTSIFVVGSKSSASAGFTVTPPAVPTLRLTPRTGPSGQYTAVYGTGFWPGETVEIRWQSDTGPVIGRITVRADGTYLGRITTRPGTPGSSRVYAVGVTSEKRTMAWYQIISSAPTMSLTTSRNLTQSGEVIAIRGSGYQPGELVEIRWISQTGTLLGRVYATSTGTISGSIRIPQGTNRNYQIFATGTTSKRYASVVHQVRNYMLAGSARVTPSSGGISSLITVAGNGMAANETVQVRWGSLTGPVVGTGTAGADGTYVITFTTPSSGPGAFDLVSVGITSYRYHSASYTVTADTTSAILYVSHKDIAPGNVILTNGRGWVPGQQVELRWNGPNGQLLGRLTVRSDGTWSGRVTIPTTATAGTYQLYAIAPSGFKSVLMTVSVTSRSSMSLPVATPTITPTPTATPVGTPGATPNASPSVVATATPTIVPTNEPVGTPTAEPTTEPTAEPTAEPTMEPTPAIEPEAIVVVDQHGSPVSDVCVVVTNTATGEVNQSCDATHDGMSDGRVLLLPGIVAGEYRVEMTNLPADIDPFAPQVLYLDGADGVDVRVTVVRQPPTPVPTAAPTEAPIPTPTVEATESPVEAPAADPLPDPAEDPAA